MLRTALLFLLGVGIGLVLLLCNGNRSVSSATVQSSINFTSVDGQQVDIAQLRGKVVLIDFWATWCPPCRAEVPALVETYQHYHDQGFEIIGISLDTNQDSLLSFTQAQHMTWPQYFDGKGWDNDISSPLGIREIPTMWLIDKQGKLVSQNVHTNLSDQVAELLHGP